MPLTWKPSPDRLGLGICPLSFRFFLLLTVARRIPFLSAESARPNCALTGERTEALIASFIEELALAFLISATLFRKFRLSLDYSCFYYGLGCGLLLYSSCGIHT